jgi:HAD superfamily hydrolase (TIGR01549 family)
MRRIKTSELASHQGAWLIFDFGNVLIEIDPLRSIKAFQALGAKADLHLDADFFHDFETGAITATEFRKALRGQLRWAAADSSIDRGWNELLLEVPPRTLAKLHQLRAKGYKLALLSNTNTIHIDEVRRRLGPFGYGEFARCFERIFYSYEMGLRKPDPAIFAAVERELGITKPKEVLFIDDNAANIASAAKHGWGTLLFQ